MDDQTPPALLEKFNADGTPRAYAGNTVICHIDRRGDFLSTLREVQGLSSHLSFSRKLALLPPASYHMTVFGGANDKHRRNPGAWPEGMRVSTPMEECSNELQKRLQALDLGPYLPIRMRVSPLPVQDTHLALRIELDSFDEREEEKLRTIRRTLATTMGLALPDPDTYRFHITIGYLMGWLNHGEMNDFGNNYTACRDLIAKNQPKIEFGRLEFCSFENMLHFQRRTFVGQAA